MDKFYYSYEGEKAIKFSTEEKTLVIWCSEKSWQSHLLRQ